MLMVVQSNQGTQTEKVKFRYKCMLSLKEIRKIVFNEEYDEDGVYKETQSVNKTTM